MLHYSINGIGITVYLGENIRSTTFLKYLRLKQFIVSFFPLENLPYMEWKLWKLKMREYN